MTKEQVEQFNTLSASKAELETELVRIEAFLARPNDNRDNQRAINNGKIMVKFAGTACMLPTGIFNGALNQRKNEIRQEIDAIDAELASL